MADNVNVSSTATYTVSTDEAASGQVQRVKLTYSADGSDTHVTADASGLLVNLGANNDVTLTSGTVTAISGTVTTSIAGTPTVALTAGTANVLNVSGTSRIGYVGVSNDGTAIADILSLTNGTALAVGVYDGDGDQLTFSSPQRIAVTPSIDTSAYAAGDNLDGTILTYANAAATDAGSGWIAKFVLLDKDAEGADWQFFFLNASLTPPAENAAFSLSDADAEKIEAVVDTSDGAWFAYGGGSVCIVPVTPPLPYKLSTGTSLYAVARSVGTPTYTSSSDLVTVLHVLRD